MNWRKSIEPRFRFDPQKAIDRLEIEKIDARLDLRRVDLENQIKKEVNEAIAVHAVTGARRKSHAEQALFTLRNLVQIDANYQAS